MGRKSTRKNKTVYQIAREKQGLTVEKAAELMEFISADRIGRIESGSQQVQSEDVLAMAECYKAPSLCNYFCAHTCAIGKRSMAKVEEKPITQIAVETVDALNSLQTQKDRLLEITGDGRVRDDESEDFREIRATLRRISSSVGALQLRIDEQITERILPDKNVYGH